MPRSEQESIVILGAGIIGLSTAYYLSTSSQVPASIHVLDNSPVLFQCASGRAAGFIAKDWFGPPLKELGELSFTLHKELAEKFDGKRRWGYSESVGLSLTEITDSETHYPQQQESRGEDWLFEGQSRRVMTELLSPGSKNKWPAWLKTPSGNLLSDTDTTAQVDPRRLCQFLLQQCEQHGVKIIYPATATSVTTDSGTGIPVAVSYHISGSSETKKIPCTSLLLAAGPWTTFVYESLFPTSKLRIPISNLAGWSVVFRDPTTPSPTMSATPCHAVFTTSTADNFSPEFFSRILPATSTGEVGRDIYLAGLNSSDIPLPTIATDVNPAPELRDLRIASLLRVAKRIISLPPVAEIPTGELTAKINDFSLEVLSTGLCHRPVTPNGIPIITRINPQHYAHDVTRRIDESEFNTDRPREGDYRGGLYVCAGHGPWGISLSLGSGKVCADLLMGNSETSAYLSTLGL